VTPPRADPREQALPWDMHILRQTEAARPGGGGWGGEGACAKGVAGSSRPGGARSGFAGSPSANGNWIAGAGRNAGGRRRNVNASAGRTPRHAEAQRKRRARARQQRSGPAGRTASAEACAWSRTERLPESFCDRPGCYDPPRSGPHVRYCGAGCAAAMRQAQDRERKCLRRNSEPGRFQRAQEYQKARVKHREVPVAKEGSPASFTVAERSLDAVLLLERNADSAIDLRGPKEKNHDPKGSLGPRPRAPPAP